MILAGNPHMTDRHPDMTDRERDMIDALAAFLQEDPTIVVQIKGLNFRLKNP